MYIDKVRAKFYLDKAYPINTLMKESVLLQLKTDEEASAFEKEQYQGMTGSLMFLMVEIRPDIAFATLITSRYAKNLSYQHIKAAKMILRYMKGFKHWGIIYGR